MTMTNKLILLLAALGQFLAPLFPVLGIGESIGARAVANGIPPELPTGIFFSIWSVVFIGYLLIAILHWRAPDHASSQLAWPLALAGVGNIIWMICAQSVGSVWVDFILLLPIGFFAWEAAYRLDRTEAFNGTGRSILYGVTVGMLAGWLTVAVSISVPDVGRALETHALAIAATIVGVYILFRRMRFGARGSYPAKP